MRWAFIFSTEHYELVEFFLRENKLILKIECMKQKFMLDHMQIEVLVTYYL